MVNLAALQNNVSEDAFRNIEQWLNEPKFAEYKAELEQLIADERYSELEDAFFKVLEFGTAGRRGATGIGSNRINRVTIGESTQALSLYVQSFDKDAASKGIVIAYDTRLTSKDLSEYAARVIAATGVKAYLFSDFRSTPELSFAVRHIGAAAGIVISASHNPPADNGFKAYWSDGAQLVAPHDKGVLDQAEAIKEIVADDFDTAVREGRIVLIDSAIDDAYLATAAQQAEGEYRDLAIVYSPLHGAGQTNTLPLLRHVGFTDIITVDEQMSPDGNFPSIPTGKPNPEEKAANDLAVKLLLDRNADIAITNDPDADRIGVIVNHQGEAIYLTGNQSAALAADYSLKQLAKRATIDQSYYLARTIVTTDLLDAIAEKYGATIYSNLLIGFKYIGELIRKKEGTGETFVIGGEESYGLLKGDYARDKDGAIGALPLAEYAAELKTDGKTLYDRLLELYREHGFYIETLTNVQFPGAGGFATMQKIMADLRAAPPTELAGEKVTAIVDYATLTRRDIQSGEESRVDCVTGNVIVFEFGNSARRITVRPSGTEPKLKLYIQWHFGSTDAPAEQQYRDALDTVAAIAQAAEQQFVDQV